MATKKQTNTLSALHIVMKLTNEMISVKKNDDISVIFVENKCY